jgi:PAS domain-containing protein
MRWVMKVMMRSRRDSVPVWGILFALTMLLGLPLKLAAQPNGAGASIAIDAKEGAQRIKLAPKESAWLAQHPSVRARIDAAAPYRAMTALATGQADAHPGILTSGRFLVAMKDEEHGQPGNRYPPVRYDQGIDWVFMWKTLGAVIAVAALAIGIFAYWKREFRAGKLLTRAEDANSRLALIENVASLRDVQRLAKVGSWTWDPRTDVAVWSEEMYRIFGRDPSLPPINFESINQSFTPESWRTLSAVIAQSQADGIPYACDAEVVRPDGTHCWIISRGLIERDAEGNTVLMRGTSQDITERKLAEAELKSEVARRRILMEASLDGIAVINGQHQMVEANQRFAEMLGYTPEEVLGLHTWDFEATMSEADILAEFSDILNTRATFETRWPRAPSWPTCRTRSARRSTPSPAWRT